MVELSDPDRWKRFSVLLLLSVTVSAILAFGHVVFGRQLLEIVSSEAYELLDTYVFFLSMAIGSLIPVGYTLYFEDVTEGFASFLVLMWALFGGLEDLFVYMMAVAFPPEKMIWLENTLPGLVRRFTALESIGGWTLVAITVFSGIMLLGVSVLLYYVNDPDTWI